LTLFTVQKIISLAILGSRLSTTKYWLVKEILFIALIRLKKKDYHVYSNYLVAIVLIVNDWFKDLDLVQLVALMRRKTVRRMLVRRWNTIVFAVLRSWTSTRRV
jgi:hypothetical protein